ncbi:MAG: PHP-associated domain-containing protein [archaeon]|nr:PHP-associated domain-containing protein [archaeon]
MRLDLHMHSERSCDSFMKADKMIGIAKKIGLDGIAITDHNALPKVKVQEGGDFLVIPGEEILTKWGEIIGLNLTEKIPSLLSVSETIDRIREQGGTVLIPHPFNVIGKCLLCNYGKIKGPFLFEAFNGDVVLNVFNVIAKNYAVKHNLAMVGSSDAHHYECIGYGYTELETKAITINGVMKDLLKGKGVPVGSKISSKNIFLDRQFNAFTQPLAKFVTWWRDWR